MNREEYLSELYGRLRQHRSGYELENTMKYYEEYFNEAGSGREMEIIAELGSPEQLVQQILGQNTNIGQADDHHKQPYEPRRWTAGKVALLICLFPIWLSLLMAMVVGVIGLVAGIGFGGVACIAGGIFSVWCGFTALFTPGFATTMLFAGMGLVAAGVGIAMVLGATALGKVISKGIVALCRWIFVGGRGGVSV